MDKAPTPHARIIKALRDIVMLSEDDNGRISRDPVMAEVQHIRDDADKLQSRLSALSARRVSEKALIASFKECLAMLENAYEGEEIAAENYGVDKAISRARAVLAGGEHG